MEHRVILLCIAALVSSCQKKIDSDPPDKGPQRHVPAFLIAITLSEAAAKVLRDAHETIKGTIDFDGEGNSRPGEYTAPMRPVILGFYDFEIDQPGVVSVDHASISEEAFKRLTDSDYYFTINVFSGRRAFTNNVLDGGYASGRISEATQKPIEINCDLLPRH